MADAITAIAASVSSFVLETATTLGASAAVANTASTIAFFGTQALIYTGINVGLAALAAPDIPKPESFATPYRSSRAPRISAYGRNKLSGPQVLFESYSGRAYDVIAWHDGRVGDVISIFAHDDQLILTGARSGWVTGYVDGTDNRYGNERLYVSTRLGLATETSYSTEIDYSGLGAGVWTANHRGDGIASVAMSAKSVEKADMSSTYPNGRPLLSVVADCLLTWDWRDEGQDPDDDDTWTTTYNPGVEMVDFLTSTHHGMGFDFATRIEPNLAEWTAEADYCDGAVALKAGGTEPRYEAHGPFQHISAPSDVLARIIEACDGWLTTKGDGTFRFRAGRYVEPDVTFTDDHVTDYTLQRFVEDEQSVNALIVSFTSPDHTYQTVETDPWRDEDDILERGVERSQDFNPTWVQSNGQVRRLAKRRMSKLAATVRGTITTNMYGIKGWGERFIRLQISEIPVLNDLVVEITGAECDLVNGRYTYNWIAADPNVDAWNPATEEGDGPADEDRVPATPEDAPTVDDVTPFFESQGTAGDGVRLRIEATGPDREDLTWYARWRVVGAVSWNEATFSDMDPSAAVVLETGFVTANDELEVSVSYETGSGSSPWSTAFGPIDTTTESVAPAAATDLSATGGVGLVDLTWRNSVSANFDNSAIHRGTSATFGSSSIIATLPGSAGAFEAYSDTSLAPGTYYYWIVARNAANVAAPPVGPQSATVT